MGQVQAFQRLMQAPPSLETSRHEMDRWNAALVLTSGTSAVTR